MLEEKLTDNYQEVYTHGDYLIWSQATIKVYFTGRFYRFETAAETVGKWQTQSAIQWLTPDDNQAVDLTFVHEYDGSIGLDGFTLSVKASHEVVIKTSNLRGLKYAFAAFERLLSYDDNQVALLVATINHQTPIEVRGVIEGFYGKPWQHHNRLDVIHFLGNQQMNTYMYAPKDDDYQRKNWRELYPKVQQDKFTELLSVAGDELVDCYYMISPGRDIDLTSSDDLDNLCTKLQQMINLGFSRFGLLFDDIDYQLKGKAAIKYTSAGAAHAALANAINGFFKQQLTTYSFVVCPTEYDNALGSSYLAILTAQMDPEIIMFWTGPQTLASQITTTDLGIMAAVYQRPMIIWDNIPVNDYQKDSELLFLSPYEQRTPLIDESRFNVKGIVSNPMPEWEASKITVGTMAQFLWRPNAYQPERALKRVISELVPLRDQAALRLFCSYNQNHFTQASLNLAQINAIKGIDSEQLDNWLKELNQAVHDLLDDAEDSPILTELIPWLHRMELDWQLWQAIKNNQSAERNEVLKDIESCHYRLGTDLVAAYLQQLNG